jgi:AAA+ ATPase superfamily predicted ATPase
MFINRIKELELLDKRLEVFLWWNWKNTYHLAFLWLRRTGKTYLLNHFLTQNKDKVNIVYFNISKFKISPYSFSK